MAFGGGGWASALGAAILGGSKTYQDVSEQDRIKKQQAAQLLLQQQQFAEQQKQDALNRAILQHKIDQQPSDDAAADVERMLKMQGIEGASDNPAFVQKNATAGTPLRIDPNFSPDALPAKPLGDLSTAVSKRQNMLRSPHTGVMLPPEVSRANIAQQDQQDAQASLTHMFKPGTPAALEVQFNAAGIKPPAALLRDPSQDWEVKTVKDMLGNERLVRVNKATGEQQGVGGGGSGAPSSGGGSSSLALPSQGGLTGADFLKTLDPKTQQIVKDMSQYKYNLGGMNGAKLKLAYGPLVSQYDPTWSDQDYANRQKLQASYSSGPRAQIATSIDQVLHHLQSLQGAGANLHNVSVPLIGPEVNRAKNFLFHRNDGLQGQQRMDAQAVASELAKIYKGTGASSEREIADWAGSVDLNDKSPEAQQRIIGQAVQLLNGALTAHRDTFERGMGKPMDFSLISPEQQKFIDNYIQGKAPMSAAPQSATPAQNSVQTPDGQTHVFPDAASAAAFKKAAGL